MAELIPGRNDREAGAFAETFRGVMHGHPAPLDADLGETRRPRGGQEVPGAGEVRAAPLGDPGRRAARLAGGRPGSDQHDRGGETVSSLTVETVREALRPIQDPEIFISIVDLGLIRAVEVTPDGTMVKVTMTLTTPVLPRGPDDRRGRQAGPQLPPRCRGIRGRAAVEPTLGPPEGSFRRSA